MIEKQKLQIAGLVAVILVAGAIGVWWRSSADLKFAELSSPKGFRTLVMETIVQPHAAFRIAVRDRSTYNIARRIL